MTTTIKALLVTAALALPLATPAVAQDTSSMSMGHSMLTGALINSLNRLGIDSSGVDDLTLNEIAQIRGVMENDDGASENQMRQEIEAILAN